MTDKIRHMQFGGRQRGGAPSPFPPLGDTSGIPLVGQGSEIVLWHPVVVAKCHQCDQHGGGYVLIRDFNSAVKCMNAKCTATYAITKFIFDINVPGSMYCEISQVVVKGAQQAMSPPVDPPPAQAPPTPAPADDPVA